MSPLRHFIQTAEPGARITYAQLKLTRHGRRVDTDAMREARKFAAEGKILLSMRRRSYGRGEGVGAIFDLIAIRRASHA